MTWYGLMFIIISFITSLILMIGLIISVIIKFFNRKYLLCKEKIDKIKKDSENFLEGLVYEVNRKDKKD